MWPCGTDLRETLRIGACPDAVLASLCRCKGAVPGERTWDRGRVRPSMALIPTLSLLGPELLHVFDYVKNPIKSNTILHDS